MRGRDISYIDKLNTDARERYVEKTTELSGFDPYDHQTEWDTVRVVEDYDKLPQLTEVSIFQYLVHGMSFCTLADFNNMFIPSCTRRRQSVWSLCAF